MKRRPRITIAQAFDMVPIGGYVCLKLPEDEIMAEADKRNAMGIGEWYSVAVRLNVFDRPVGALVTRQERWDNASETSLMGVVRFASKYML